MEKGVHRLTLDLTGPDMLPRVEVQQDNARSLVIALTQGGRPYWIAEGVTAVFSGRKPDGNPLFNGCTVEKNRVRYDFTAQTTNVAGIVECEILLYSGDERILASPRFELSVEELIHREGDVPESAPELSALTQMMAAGTAMIEDLREALAGLENVEEILEQARDAANAASASKQAAEDAAAAARDNAVNASSEAQHALASAGEANQGAQRAEAAARRAEEALRGSGVSVEILSETELESDDDGWYVRQFIPHVIDGQTYTVRYNGAAYECVGRAYDENGLTGVGLGNYRIVGGDDTGEPFAMLVTSREMFDFSGVGAIVMRVSGDAPRTVGIDGPLPDGLDLINTAIVGQAVRVAAVDENGKPVQWEAVDFPEGGNGSGGADGFSPIAKVTQTESGAVIEITDKDGTTTATVKNGSDGRGIASMKQTTTSSDDGGINVFTFTMDNGSSMLFRVKNGSKGSTGATGPQGPAYVLTPADRASITAAVIDALPKYDGEVVAV